MKPTKLITSLLSLIALSVVIVAAQTKDTTKINVVTTTSKSDTIVCQTTTTTTKEVKKPKKSRSIELFEKKLEGSKFYRQRYVEGTFTMNENDTTFISGNGLVAFTYSGEEAIKMAVNSRELGSKWHPQQGHWGGFGLMFNGLVSNLGDLSLPQEASWMKQSAKSIGVELNFVDYVIFSSGCFGVITGVGMEINNFRFSDAVRVTNDPATGMVIPDYETFSAPESGWEKTKITTAYFQVPLLMEFQFNVNKYNSGWVNFGVVGSLCYEAYTKDKSDAYGKQKHWSNMNIPLFRYGFEMSFGIEDIGIKAKYYPDGLFTPGMGPRVNQFNIGLVYTFM